MLTMVRLYLCPALMDGLAYFVLFSILYAAGERGLSLAQCAWLGGTFQLAYMTASLILGRLLSRRNARLLMLLGAGLFALFGACGLVTTSFPPLLGLVTAAGVAMALFFNAFQTFMRGESAPGELSRTVAWYTLAWSSGMSMGFLLSGYLFRLGPAVMALVTIVTGGLTTCLLIVHRARPIETLSAEEHIETGPADMRPVHPAYVGVGWVMIFTVMFIQRPVTTFYPSLCARAGISAFMAGLPLFLHLGMQAGAGAAMFKGRALLYRRTPLVFFQLLAAAMFLIMWWWPSYLMTMVCLTISGVYAAFAYFCAVYYASNAGNRSFNTGINEFLVGLGSFAGIFVSEWGMKQSGRDETMYLVCSLALAVSIMLQCSLASLPRKQDIA